MVISTFWPVKSLFLLFRWLIPQLFFPMPRHLPPFRGLPPTHGRHWPLQLICNWSVESWWKLDLFAGDLAMTPIPKKSFLIFSELNKHHLNLQRSGYCASKGVLHAGTKPCLFAARQVPEFVPLSPMIHCSFFRRRVIQSPDGGNGFQFWWLILMGKPETCLERPWPQKHLLRHGRHGWWSDQEGLTNVCVCVRVRVCINVWVQFWFGTSISCASHLTWICPYIFTQYSGGPLF
jgi:hypothetical protein